MAPAGLPTHTSYWFSSRRSFRSCRVRLSLTRLHAARSGPSPLVDSPLLFVCAYLGRLCTQRVCWPPTNPPCACARSFARSLTHTLSSHNREETRQDGGEDESSERRKTERKREKDDVCLRTPLFRRGEEIGPPRSNRGRRFGTGQKHRSAETEFRATPGRVRPAGTDRPEEFAGKREFSSRIFVNLTRQNYRGITLSPEPTCCGRCIRQLRQELPTCEELSKRHKRVVPCIEDELFAVA